MNNELRPSAFSGLKWPKNHFYDKILWCCLMAQVIIVFQKSPDQTAGSVIARSPPKADDEAIPTRNMRDCHAPAVLLRKSGQQGLAMTT